MGPMRLTVGTLAVAEVDAELGIEVKTVLTDQARGEQFELPATIEVKAGAIAIGFDGYGDHNSAEGYGRPVYIERLNGKLRLVVWADINDEEPTHVIELEDALESNRDA